MSKLVEANGEEAITKGLAHLHVTAEAKVQEAEAKEKAAPEAKAKADDDAKEAGAAQVSQATARKVPLVELKFLYFTSDNVRCCFQEYAALHTLALYPVTEAHHVTSKIDTCFDDLGLMLAKMQGLELALKIQLHPQWHTCSVFQLATATGIAPWLISNGQGFFSRRHSTKVLARPVQNIHTPPMISPARWWIACASHWQASTCTVSIGISTS